MKGWRTIVFNLAAGLVAVYELTSDQVPEEWKPYLLGAYIVGNVVLRVVTTTPVGMK